MRLLPPHARLSLSYDLQAYVASASELRREKAELPLCFALQLQAEVGGGKVKGGRGGKGERGREGKGGNGEGSSMYFYSSHKSMVTALGRSLPTLG